MGKLFKDVFNRYKKQIKEYCISAGVLIIALVTIFYITKGIIFLWDNYTDWVVFTIGGIIGVICFVASIDSIRSSIFEKDN